MQSLPVSAETVSYQGQRKANSHDFSPSLCLSLSLPLCLSLSVSLSLSISFSMCFIGRKYTW
uniref:Uncharacterized protein n=1 Tax=Anguilla anguilla TaxID=7936 RepID=A0A0E9SS05_ANGAN